ncbi:hypothetical protein AAG906_040054 [Vitis piasezkii]
MEIVKELWDDIRERCSIGNGPRVQQLRSDLENCKQNGQAIDELNNYEKISVCNCAGCKCNLMIILEKKREKERVHQFLMGLDEEGYDTVHLNILSTEPLMRTVTRIKKERGNPMSFAMKTEGGRKRGAHGGHDKGGTTRANAATKNDVDKKGIGGLNDEQWATLMGMLSAHKIGTNERLMGKQSQLPWIIDSRASNHMTSVYTCMREVRDIDPCPIGLPDGVEIMALKERIAIGVGEQHEGLYFLKGAALVHAFKMNGVTSFELWHRRMGHPSSKVLGLIPEVVCNNRNENKVCDVCFRAKQTREILYDLETDEYFVSRDVVFVETDFPFADKDVTTDDLNVYRTHNWSAGIEVDCDEGKLTNADVSAKEGNLEDDVVEEDNTVDESLGRGQRVKVPSVHLKDYVTHTIKSGPLVHSPFQSNSLGHEPTTYAEVAKEECWRDAMRKEIQALEENGTWTLVNLPPRKKAIGSKWVYKIKYHSDGSAEC